MTKLFLHSREMKSVFQLLGENENDISYSVAWGLTQCPSFLKVFLQNVLNWNGSVEEVDIRMQEYEKGKGFTDIEIELTQQFHLIIEAKRGWNLPGIAQLQKYATRTSFLQSPCPDKRLIVLSECSKDYAKHRVPDQVNGFPVEVLSWKDFYQFSKMAHASGTHAEKRLLQELNVYLGSLMTMQKQDSNMVYVVSVGGGSPEGWTITWRDIINKKRRYFHPVGGNGWVKEPPNYIAFRYDGKLQSIHHIEGYEVVTNMSKVFSEAKDEEWEPSFVYHLGAPFSPSNEIKTGNIYPNGRVWCMLDTLFTCSTISEARDLTKSR
ncbi:hypothetical protein PCCS19_21580 [Paenibacillus sp. CCS19]|uniref:hypothetical protein n=1 Tax=Paenibacillus sp. CCS19 TaxID=3158387 RepID=UPI002562849C|nr:hypothetical protein [Paenibacillus cellulosilyticus]GMK39104.1 hypothetical protein PCCS19_21580 [Paenibacillus cellulosilyticus]